MTNAWILTCEITEAGVAGTKRRAFEHPDEAAARAGLTTISGLLSLVGACVTAAWLDPPAGQSERITLR